MQEGSSIRLRVSIAIALGFLLPSVLGMVFVVHVVGVLDVAQLRLLMGTSLIPYYIIGTIIAATLYFRWFLRPVFELADGSRSLESTFPRMRAFAWHYWGLLLLRNGIGACVVMLSPKQGLGIDIESGVRINFLVLSLPMSVLIGLPIFAYVIDCFAQACDTSPLKKPLFTVRTRVLLTTVLVPVFLNVIIVVFLRARVRELSTEILLIYTVLTLFSVATAYTLMHSLNRSVAELRKVSQYEASDLGDLRLQSMDEFGVLTSDYRRLLGDLNSQATLMELRNRILLISKGDGSLAQLYTGLMSMVVEVLDVDDAAFVVVKENGESREYAAKLKDWPKRGIEETDVLRIELELGAPALVVNLRFSELEEDVACVALPCSDGEADGESRLVLIARMSTGMDMSPDKLERLGLLREELISAIHSTKVAEENAKLAKMLVESQRMEMISHLAAGVAHDFNNILTVVVGATDVLLEEVVEIRPDNSTLVPLVQRQADMIKESSRRAVALTKQLLTFSGQQVGNESIVMLNDAIVRAERYVAHGVRSKVALEYNLHEDLGGIRADAGHIDQVIGNLLVNASDAMPDGGTIKVWTRQEAGWVVLEVTDDGMGMDEKVLAHVFDPFFTTKTREKGTGLGLATVEGIVTNCGGTIAVKSVLGKGSSFTLRFPMADELVSESSAILEETQTSQERESVSSSLSVLLAEDDENVRRMVGLVLKRRGYTVIEAADGIEALQFITTKELEIDLLLSDILMPGLKGTEVASHMLQERPDGKILLMTGFADSSLLEEAELKGIHVMDKPFSPKDLLVQIDTLLRHKV